MTVSSKSSECRSGVAARFHTDLNARWLDSLRWNRSNVTSAEDSIAGFSNGGCFRSAGTVSARHAPEKMYEFAVNRSPGMREFI
jgi:hypothetical protein